MFGKKVTLDDILKGIDNLSDEDKEKVRAKVADLDKAEDEREIDKIEEDKAGTDEKAAEKAAEVDEESEEIGKDVDEIEEEEELDEEPASEEEHGENDDLLEEPQEAIPEWGKEILARLSQLEQATADKTVEEEAKEVYGLGNGVFQGNEEPEKSKKMTPSDVAKTLSRIKR